MRKREIERILKAHIIPALRETDWVIWDGTFVLRQVDELLMGVLLDRSEYGRGVYLSAFVFPLMTPAAEDLALTFSERTNQFGLDVPGWFEMESEEQESKSIIGIIDAIRKYHYPLFDKISCSADLLRLHDASEGAPIFTPTHKEYAAHYWEWMGYVAAHCGRCDRVREFFAKSRSILEGHQAYWVPPHLADMAHLEALLHDEQAVHEHLAANAYETRRVLKLPFPFDATKYGLPTGWSPATKSETTS